MRRISTLVGDDRGSLGVELFCFCMSQRGEQAHLRGQRSRHTLFFQAPAQGGASNSPSKTLNSLCYRLPETIYALLPPLCRGCNTLWVDLLIKSTLTDAAPLQQSPVFLVNFSFLLRYSFQHRNRKALERGVLRCAQITKSLIFIFEILRFLNPPLVD